MSSVHPFEPLTPEEISKAAGIVQIHFASHTGPLKYRVITLKEPPKEQMLAFLEQEHSGQAITETPPRVAMVQVLIPGDGTGPHKLFEVIVNLDKESIVEKQHLVGKHSYIDAEYMKEVERACMADPSVKEEIISLDLPEGATVCVEPWAYATDGMNDMTRRVTMCWFYMRLVDNPDANYYAYPLDLCAEVSEDLKVTKVYRLPSTEDERINNNRKKFDRRKIHVSSEYHPLLKPASRETTKPYHVTQPDGPSFTTKGNLILWEKWQMRVGFNYREGLTLHDVRYDKRSLFYRLSLAEMFVPYGDPRSPYPRKGAFDVGNDGAGINANNLRLGCDCLGLIKYFDGWHNMADGTPMRLPNVVCCHEVDDGILWKHTNFRTGNAVLTRSRVLVLQSIITVSNYEYIFAFHFGQDGSLRYEVRATGILSTCPIGIDDKVPRYGTRVAPGVLAPYHQHMFCLRIDPTIDGPSNSLQVEETEAMPVNDPDIHNPFGVGFQTKSHIIPSETGLDLDFSKNRVFKIVNESSINPITGTPVAFKLVPSYSQMLLAHPTSFHAKRSEFGEHAVWVTRYHDDELFPSGRYTMQSSGDEKEGIASKIKERRDNQSANTSVRNEDIVVWHTFGSTHIPRIEDWPVMPSEKMVIELKPVNFFTGNPGLDVPVSTQERNHSALVSSGEGH